MKSRDENVDDGRMGAPAQKREDHMWVLDFANPSYGDREDQEARNKPAGLLVPVRKGGDSFVKGRPGRGD